MFDYIRKINFDGRKKRRITSLGFGEQRKQTSSTLERLSWSVELIQVKISDLPTK